jgi:hypothetical protein
MSRTPCFTSLVGIGIMPHSAFWGHSGARHRATLWGVTSRSALQGHLRRTEEAQAVRSFAPAAPLVRARVLTLKTGYINPNGCPVGAQANLLSASRTAALACEPEFC